jgi:hypothetical protein
VRVLESVAVITVDVLSFVFSQVGGRKPSERDHTYTCAYHTDTHTHTKCIRPLGINCTSHTYKAYAFL